MGTRLGLFDNFFLMNRTLDFYLLILRVHLREPEKDTAQLSGSAITE